MPETVANAVAKRDASPAQLIRRYSASFGAVLPSHVPTEHWVRLAEGALRKGKKVNAPNPKDRNHVHHGRFELEVAAGNNPGIFLAALLDSARLGLTPGTEEYYLTARRIGGPDGQLEILGIVGYQGYVELMYRAGAVTSVIVDVVRQNDLYRYQRGVTPEPIHEYPPFARDAERGTIIGAYAYARLVTGDISQVVTLNLDDLERIKRVNPLSGKDYSPWVGWEAAMCKKSAARQLRKWVPTSAEYRQELARAAAEVRRVVESGDMPPGVETPQGDTIEGSWDEPEAYDVPGEVVP